MELKKIKLELGEINAFLKHIERSLSTASNDKLLYSTV